jgi:hypothetical protein
MSMAPAIEQLSADAEDTALAPIVWASVLGTVIEWYDFLIYGTAAALIFNKLFFPTLDPLAGTLAAFGSYAVGFVARPLGGAIFGHFGDKLGRAHGHHDSDGRRNIPHRMPSDLFANRDPCPSASGHSSAAAGRWRWRRVGWRCTHGDRARTEGQARPLR